MRRPATRRRRTDEPLPVMVCCVCNLPGEIGRSVLPLATKEWVHKLDCWPKLIAQRAEERARA